MAVFSVNAGLYANHLEGVAAGNVTGSDADSFYPFTNLERAYARDPWLPARHTTPAAADVYVTIDKNRPSYPDAEGLAVGPLASDPYGLTHGWVVTLDDPGDPAGSVNVVSTPVQNGTRAYNITVGVGEAGNESAQMHKDIKIRAGEVGTVQVYLRGDGTRIARAQVIILERGLYVTSTGTLTATPTDFHTNATTIFVLEEADFTAPAYTQQKPDGSWTLRLLYYMTDADAGNSYMDGFYYWPHTNTAAVVGHNVMPVISALQLRRSNDAFSANDVLDTTLSVYHPNLYSLLGGMRTERWWRLKTVGTNAPDSIWWGQPWLLQRIEFERSPNYGFQERRARDYKEQRTTSGAARRYHKEDIRRVDLVFSWTHPDDADHAAVLGHIFERGMYGDGPALIIRSTTDPKSAHMVNVPGEYLTDYIEAAPSDADGRARDVPEMVFPGLAYPTFVP